MIGTATTMLPPMKKLTWSQTVTLGRSDGGLDEALRRCHIKRRAFLRE
jgi:hypothetical protein